MYRQMSRAQREAAFLEKAAQMYASLEDWYDQHPDQWSGHRISTGSAAVFGVWSGDGGYRAWEARRIDASLLRLPRV